MTLAEAATSDSGSSAIAGTQQATGSGGASGPGGAEALRSENFATIQLSSSPCALLCSTSVRVISVPPTAEAIVIFTTVTPSPARLAGGPAPQEVASCGPAGPEAHSGHPTVTKAKAGSTSRHEQHPPPRGAMRGGIEQRGHRGRAES